MNPMVAYDLDKAYRQQQMQNAENERAAKTSRATENRPVHRTILAGVGSQMVAWGMELQLRYGNTHVGDAGDIRRVRLSLLNRAR